MKDNKKNILRKEILTLLRHQKEEDRKTKSGLIGEKLLILKEFKEADKILFYMSFDGEVETATMISETQKLGKKVLLPKIDQTRNRIIPAIIRNLKTDLEPGPYGIMQPTKECHTLDDLSEIDLAIVPGVCFDKKNNRLGRGGGYYDRFLSDLPQDVSTIGIAFDFQIVESIPNLESHDYPVSAVLHN